MRTHHVYALSLTRSCDVESLSFFPSINNFLSRDVFRTHLLKRPVLLIELLLTVTNNPLKGIAVMNDMKVLTILKIREDVDNALTNWGDLVPGWDPLRDIIGDLAPGKRENLFLKNF